MTSFFRTKKWRRLSHIIYSIGAAVVILGALFKINHYSIGIFTGESILAVGLVTEVIIFILFSFEPPAKEYDWSLVYPELIGMKSNRVTKQTTEVIDGFKKLNKLLEDANINSSVVQKLGEGINKLEDTASKLVDISDAAFATNDYVKNMNHATTTIKSATEINIRIQDSMNDLVNNLSLSVKNSEELRSQTDSLTKNLSALNKVYGNMLIAMNVEK